MRRIKLDDGYYYIDDDNVNIGTGEALDISDINNSEEKLSNTAKIKIIDKEELLQDTITDLWGENND